MAKADENKDNYDVEKDVDLVKESDGTQELNRNPLMNAGQSKRIWGELYKVLDSSDVIIQVLDARDPQGTRLKALDQILPTFIQGHDVDTLKSIWKKKNLTNI